jgi:hypothetical protein
MIITIVIDPEAFNKETFLTEVHTINAEDIIKSLKKNSLIIVDADNKMKDQIYNNIKRLPRTIKKKLQMEFEHILRYKGGNIISCLNFNYNECFNFIDIYKEIINSPKKQYIDVMITNKNGLKDLCREGIKDEENVILLKEYRDSKIEKKREEFFEGSESLDRLELFKVDELISRVLWYTRKLSFYDPIIGNNLSLIENSNPPKRSDSKSEEHLEKVNKLRLIENSNWLELNISKSKEHLEKWYDGISYILTLWENNCYFKEENKKIEIFTETMWLPRIDDYNEYKKVRLKIKNFINDNLIIPLCLKFSWCNITLHIKNRKYYNIFRSRYLQTENTIIKFEKGFDLKKNGKFLRNDLSFKSDAARDLIDIRKIKEI